jgi:hypothetical protein
VDVEEAEVYVRDRHGPFQVARIPVVAVGDDDGRPKARIGLRVETTEKSPVELALELKCLHDRTAHAGTAGEWRGIVLELGKGRELARHELVG